MKFLLLLSMSLILGCQHSIKQSNIISESTSLPAVYLYKNYPNLPDRIFVPSSLVEFRYVGRSHVEVREGPSINFKLKDYILPYGFKVVVLDELKSWRKILMPEIDEIGWVNYKALYPASEKELIAINPKKLSVVVAKKAIKEISGFKGENLATKIGVGKAFLVLKEQNGRYLIWLKDTASVAWVGAGYF